MIDSITEEVHILYRKKQEACVNLKNAPSNDISHLKTEYNHLKKLTKVAADKVCNSWWSDCATEAQCRAFIAEQQSRGGSLIGNLHHLKMKFSKPFPSALVANDGITLQSDGDKLNCWAEHFEEVMNCQVDINVVPCEDLPIVSPLFVSSDTWMSDEDLSVSLSEEEIVTAISELRSRKAPGLVEINL